MRKYAVFCIDEAGILDLDLGLGTWGLGLGAWGLGLGAWGLGLGTGRKSEIGFSDFRRLQMGPLICKHNLSAGNITENLGWQGWQPRYVLDNQNG